MSDLHNNIDKYIEDISSSLYSNKKFSLKKKHSRTVRIISKPKISHVKLNKEDINEIRKKTLGNELIKFRKKLYKKFKSENLNLLNNNLKTLKINIKYFAPEILLLKFASGTYEPIKNKIKIIKLFKKGTSKHEFFHMATSFYHNELKIGLCGFAQFIYPLKETVGNGLNEGYTDLLTNRYFYEKVKFGSYSYNVCTFFVSKLEEIIGKDRMETFYLNADLYGLCKYMESFDDEDYFISFICKLDNLLKNVSIFNPKKYKIEYELIECYLAKWYINKKQKELDNKQIDQYTFDKQIKDYIDSLGNEDLYIDNYVKEKEYCLK